MGSFRKAAQEFGLDQSTVSRRIQVLEDRNGIALFERLPSGARLTPLGAQFLADAGLAIVQLQQAITRAQDALSRQLRVGIVAALPSSPLGPSLQTFRRQNPDIAMKLQLGKIADHLADLRAGNLDVAFLPGDLAAKGYRVCPAWHDHAVVALPAHHRLASGEWVQWDEVSAERFLFAENEVDPGFKAWVMARLSLWTSDPLIEMHRVGVGDIVNMVALGFGLSIFCSTMGSSAYPGVAFRRLADDESAVSWSAVWSATERNPSLRKFIRLLRSRRPADAVDPG